MGNFDGHCCVPKTCELDMCTANGNFDDDCGKDGPCPAAFDLGGESSSDDLDKCAECSMKTKNEWCGGCLQCLHDLHLKYDSDTKKIKSDWKVKAKVEEKAPAPTPKPKSKLPTFAPTPKPTNPKKPTFEKAKHEKAKKKFKVVTKIADKTRPPTMAPTKAPTHKGYKIVKRKQKRKAAKATLAFPITAAEAKNPVMQEALTTGVANSLGKDPADVKITSIDGVAITRRRRRSRSAQDGSGDRGYRRFHCCECAGGCEREGGAGAGFAGHGTKDG